MAIFRGDEASWQRIDFATIAGTGLVAVELEDAGRCRAWLDEEGYRIETLDCRRGVAHFDKEINRIFDWTKQFGYVWGGREQKPNLDALRDGFNFDIADKGGVVLVLDGIDRLWVDQPRLTVGLLCFAAEHTRWQIAKGRRFFTVLLVDPGTPLIGKSVDAIELGVPWHWPMRA